MDRHLELKEVAFDYRLQVCDQITTSSGPVASAKCKLSDIEAIPWL